jgi:hypothetical protein
MTTNGTSAPLSWIDRAPNQQSDVEQSFVAALLAVPASLPRPLLQSVGAWQGVPQENVMPE